MKIPAHWLKLKMAAKAALSCQRPECPNFKEGHSRFCGAVFEFRTAGRKLVRHATCDKIVKGEKNGVEKRLSIRRYVGHGTFLRGDLAPRSAQEGYADQREAGAYGKHNW